jgi:hypothetical protein
MRDSDSTSYACKAYVLPVKLIPLAPEEGVEPTTHWLTANCSTIELPRNKMLIHIGLEPMRILI